MIRAATPVPEPEPEYEMIKHFESNYFSNLRNLEETNFDRW